MKGATTTKRLPLVPSLANKRKKSIGHPLFALPWCRAPVCVISLSLSLSLSLCVFFFGTRHFYVGPLVGCIFFVGRRFWDENMRWGKRQTIDQKKEKQQTHRTRAIFLCWSFLNMHFLLFSSWSGCIA
nr:hypothetical protein [Pandoravirus aubagnensis]